MFALLHVGSHQFSQSGLVGFQQQFQTVAASTQSSPIGEIFPERQVQVLFDLRMVLEFADFFAPLYVLFLACEGHDQFEVYCAVAGGEDEGTEGGVVEGSFGVGRHALSHYVLGYYYVV